MQWTNCSVWLQLKYKIKYLLVAQLHAGKMMSCYFFVGLKFVFLVISSTLYKHGPRLIDLEIYAKKNYQTESSLRVKTAVMITGWSLWIQ